MKKFVCLSFILVGLGVLAAGAAWAQETDAEGTKDHPLLSRMPGYFISQAENKDFDAHSFWIDGDKQMDVEGKSTHIFYVLQPNAKEPSRLEILRQYENAIKKIAGSASEKNCSFLGLQFLE